MTRAKINLDAFCVIGARAANCLARSKLSASSSSGSPVLYTNPCARSSCTEINSASKSIRFTIATPKWAVNQAILLGDKVLPKVRAMGTPNLAFGVAIRKSHKPAIAKPPPTASPSITAIVGMGSCWSGPK